MTILIFIVILAVLVFVHELGHFVFAKGFGIRVDEFALGFPPRIISKQIGETKYSLNLIPFGGYVKIFGEDAVDVLPDSPDRTRSLLHKNRAIQAAVLTGGVFGNIVFAWLLLSIVFMTGAPVSSADYVGTPLENQELLVVNVLPDSPAGHAGIKVGDAIISLQDVSGKILSPTVEAVQQFISTRDDKEVTIELKRGTETLSVSMVPQSGVIGKAPGIGISMDVVGTLKLSFPHAILEGGKKTLELGIAITQSIGTFLYQAITFQANLSEISGPVGIAVLVGSARELGFFYIISFTALISLNLAVINLLPFPALDGGRLFFVLIESIIRRRINSRFQHITNSVGFAILITLLLVVTYKDVVHLF